MTARTALASRPRSPAIDQLDNPYAPVEFQEQHGLILAKLDCVVVGMIYPGNFRGCYATWVCCLPDTTRAPQRSPSADDARERLSRRVHDWIEAAGLRV